MVKKSFAILTIDERGAAQVARFASARGEQKGWRAVKLMALFAIALDIFANVLIHPIFGAVNHLSFFIRLLQKGDGARPRELCG